MSGAIRDLHTRSIFFLHWRVFSLPIDILFAACVLFEERFILKQRHVRFSFLGPDVSKRQVLLTNYQLEFSVE